ncbi:MAG: T9SS type A sorting domain-containing protein [Bacteroidetes bacterium]|nr:MAG: T9SS type A sorting domain-containing protein [Bacteroidota bacterium]
MKTNVLFLLLLPLSLFSQNILLPGDANNDGRVDHLDLLAIGLNTGKTGPPRPTQGLNWMPMDFTPWAGSLPQTGVNAGFSDCDGDGIVTNDDVLAIKLHYDSLQNASFPPPAPYLPVEPAPTTAVPGLVFTFDRDTVGVSDTLRLSVFYVHPFGLPEPASPFGVAFRLEFDEFVIQDSLTRVFFEPAATDLLFAAGATGFADSRAVSPGQVEFSAAGRRAPRLSFSRPLGVFEFIIEDVIVRSDTFWRDFKIDVTDVLFLDTLERVFEYEVDIDEVVLFQPLDSFAVCPGDANNDGRVSSLDILALGMAYKQEGIPRLPQYQGVDWEAHPYEPWAQTLPGTGINLAFCDSDGNGIVDEADALAIQLHYDSTHTLAVPASTPYLPPPSDLMVFTKPELEFRFASDTVKAGDSLRLEVLYTPPETSQLEAIPAGISFVLTFDESLVRDELTRVSFPDTDELLVAAGASGFALARGVPPGVVEIGISDKTKLPEFPALGLPAKLCTVTFFLENNLPAGHPDRFKPEIRDVLVINQLEQAMEAGVKLDETVIPALPGPGTAPLPVQIYPSPFRETFYLESGTHSITNIRVYAPDGKLVIDRHGPFPEKTTLNTEMWPPGIYQVEVTGLDGRSARKQVAKF